MNLYHLYLMLNGFTAWNAQSYYRWLPDRKVIVLVRERQVIATYLRHLTKTCQFDSVDELELAIIYLSLAPW